ncbi:MAG: tetratricopeptide repeat protein, partial [Anaerolineae bacterium]|nr:tetratricopeptide repeat protein [Anaerolineae bacterium]
ARQEDTKTQKEKTTLVEPVAEDEYMVLVAELERIGTEERPVTRFMVNELTQTLEREVPFSNYRVRAYPQVITTPQEAQEAAEANGAILVVWGNYDANTANVEIQIGVADAFPYITISRDMLERMANVTVQVNNPQTESIAPMVIQMTQVLETANGNAFNLLRNIAVLDELAVTRSEITSGGVSALVHRFFEFYIDDTIQSVDAMNAAVALDAGNPLLYTMRGIANYRIGRTEDGRRDAATSQRLGGETWINHHYMLGNEAFYIHNDLDSAIEEYNRVIELRPNDWFSLTFRGVMYYAKGDYQQAKADLDRAIELGPEANWPYIYASILALREGRISDAQAYADIVVNQFPDPTLANRGIVGFYGNAASNFIGLTFSAAGNMLLGRYSEVLPDVEAALAIDDRVADLYMMRGFAYCNLGDFDNASEAYTNAILLDSDFALLYLLRAETRLQMQRPVLALQDSNRASGYELGAEYQALLDAANQGKVGCHNFFDFKF